MLDPPNTIKYMLFLIDSRTLNLLFMCKNIKVNIYILEDSRLENCLTEVPNHSVFSIAYYSIIKA